MSSELSEFDTVDDFRMYACIMGSQTDLKTEGFCRYKFVKNFKGYLFCYYFILFYFYALGKFVYYWDDKIY